MSWGEVPPRAVRDEYASYVPIGENHAEHRSPGFDPAEAYRIMVRSRLVEEALVEAWADGLIPGEYHSGIGQEGITAGVVMHLWGDDTMALDHRNTGPMVARGVDLLALMLEVMGSEKGMNRGNAGHMHLMAPDLHAKADGIVGASGPLAVGNAVAIQQLCTNGVSVAFDGEGAVNQGMLMESYNLAVAWRLPVVFVCKDNRWSITIPSKEVTGGSINDRAHSFGLAVETARGDRVNDVFDAAGKLLRRARRGKGPGFLHVMCHRPGGHFEGDPVVRILRHPTEQARELGPGIRDAATAATGGSRMQRARGVSVLSGRGARAARDWTISSRKDPLRDGRGLLDGSVATRIEAVEHAAVVEAMRSARRIIGTRPVFGAGRRLER